MNCASIHTHFSAWIDGELPSDIREQVDLHLAECATCRTHLGEMQQLDQQLRQELMPLLEQTKALASSTQAALATQIAGHRRGNWRLVSISIASAAAGFILAVVLLPELQKTARPIPSIPQPDAKQAVQELPVQLALAIGAVEYEDQGNWKPLNTGATLHIGQRIRTLARSRCELRSTDGTELRLNNNSDVIIHSPRQVQLKQGQIWSTVAADPLPFQVKTDQSTVTALGTQFDLEYRQQQTTLTVLEGKTRFDLADRTAEVGAGQQLRIDTSKKSFEIRNPDYALFQATNWVNEILILKGRNNPALTHRINDLLASIGETKMGYLAEEEMRTLGDHCVLPLCRFLQSERSRPRELQRQTAAHIIADLAQPRSIGDLIELLADSDVKVRLDMVRGLQRLTKQDLGFTTRQWQATDELSRQQMQKAWRAWWSKNAHRYPEAGS